MDLTPHLERLRAAQRQPSLSGAAATDGRLAWADAVGDADLLGTPRPPGPETQYRIASLTKPQVAVALLRLADAGAVDLHRPLATWVPDAPGGDATPAQFLAHTSGLPAEPAGAWWERAGGHAWSDLVAMGLPRLAPPGTRFHYSNVGYAVLGKLLETLTGARWDAALANLIWTPLGMSRTGRLPDAGHAVGVAVHPEADLLHPEPVADYRALGAAGELWSTPSDLVRFGAFLAGDGAGLLRPATLALLRTPVALADVADAPWTSAHGLGLAIENVAGRRVHGHSGSVPGFTADLRLDVASRTVVAVCGNSTTPFGGARDLLDAAIAARGPVAAPGPAAPAPTAADLVGAWYWGPRAHRLAVRPDGLLVLTGAGQGTSLFAPDADGYVGVGGDYFHGERLIVVRDRTGGVRALDVGTFCFTRTPYDPAADLPGGADPGGWRRPRS